MQSQRTLLKRKTLRRRGRTLYFAYGMNTNIESMAMRCPAAEPITRLAVPNWELVFRGPADVRRVANGEVHGGLWWITPECERSLDRLEGFRRSAPERGYYGKHYFTIKFKDARHEVMMYVMNQQYRRGMEQPSQDYFETLLEGADDFGFPKDGIMRALDAAIKFERETDSLREEMAL